MSRITCFPIKRNASPVLYESSLYSKLSYNLVHEQPLHSDYITLWCGFTADVILGPFLFKKIIPQGPKIPLRVPTAVKFFSSKLFLSNKKKNV
ncbi:hypothetical protein AVEN_252546-1 [Araneus ventricosus]|uniref:Uncharacterized protein n=1 Tax=Araneus ventricosus TaxID=182803 RepID=A0A4Y2AT39_ARAVE|nr:hypothetical protein AVEN_252546-1 [Araneus ventricosus]